MGKLSKAILVLAMLLLPVFCLAGELDDKRHEREIAVRDLEIVRLQIRRDTSELHAIKERVPRLQGELQRLADKLNKLDAEIKKLEGKQNEKIGTPKPAPSVPPAS